MAKHCLICKNTEDFFLQQKDCLLEKIKQELVECEKNGNTIIDITKEKLGFTDEIKEKVKCIQNVYSEMTLKAVLENKESFLKLEPNLNIVLDYCLKYGKTNSRTIGDVIKSFLAEPVEIRYAKEVRDNNYKKAQLLQRKEKLEAIKTFLIEKEITPHTLDLNINKLKRAPENYNHVVYCNFSQGKKVSEEKDFSFSYVDLGFDFNRKIFICPVCLSLFAEASNASFDIVEAQRKAQHDAEMVSNWDDWDDDDF